MEKTTAILTSRYRLSETSLIIHWSSAEEGLFKTVANGALRPNSPFAGRLDLFITAEVAFTRSRRSDLHTLKELHITQPQIHLRTNYTRVLAATYFCRLIESTVEKETPLHGVHILLENALTYLGTHDPSLRALEKFESRLCEELGLGLPQHGAAAILHETFHRPLPPQRSALIDELKRIIPPPDPPLSPASSGG